MIDFVRIAVGVNSCNDRNVQFVSFQNCNVFFARVNDEHSTRQFFHIFDTAQIFGQFFHFMFQNDNFFFRQNVKSAVSFHCFQFAQTSNTGLNGFEVSQHTAQPTFVYEEHVATGSFVFHSFLSLFFGTNEQNVFASSSNFTDEVISFVNFFYSFLQVDDVDTIAFSEDVRSHFRVPTTGLVTKVYTSFK